MKTRIFLLVVVVLTMEVCNVHAAIYNIGPGDNFGNLGLVDYDTLLMTGGEGHNLSLGDWTIATIENTAPLIDQYSGGIWAVTTTSYSIFNFSDGEINSLETAGDSTVNMSGGILTSLEMHSESTAHISGGWIDTLKSNQSLFFDHSDEQFHGRINIYCLDWEYDPVGSLLTGTWEDSSTFNINLIDIGTVPTYDYIEFHIIPEPATLFIFALGGLLLRC